MLLILLYNCVQFIVITIHTVFSVRFSDLRDSCTVRRVCKLYRNLTQFHFFKTNQMRVHYSLVCSRVNKFVQITNPMCHSKFTVQLLKGYHYAFPKLQSVISEIHHVDMKTKMYFMHGVGTYEWNFNEKSYLYRHVFVTDREILKRKFSGRVLGTLPIAL